MKNSSLYLPYGNGKAFGTRVHGRLLTAAELRDLGSATRLLDNMQLFVDHNKHIINMPISNDPAALEAAAQVFINKLTPSMDASFILPSREARRELLAMSIGGNAIRGHGVAGSNRVCGIVDGALGTMGLWVLAANSATSATTNWTALSSTALCTVIGGGGGAGGAGASAGQFGYGGGGGALAQILFTNLAVGAAYSATAGVGGAGGSSGGTSGTSGSNSTFNGLTGGAGGGGSNNAGGLPGTGGTASGPAGSWLSNGVTATGAAVAGGNSGSYPNGNVAGKAGTNVRDSLGPGAGGSSDANGPDHGGGGVSGMVLIAYAT